MSRHRRDCEVWLERLELDRVREGVHDRHGVLHARLDRQVVELLDRLRRVLLPDDELERLVRRAVRGLGDLDLELVAAVARIKCDDAECLAFALLLALACGRQFGPGVVLTRLHADADDVGETAAVREIAEDRVRQVRPLDEVAEALRELGPVRDQRRLVERPLSCEPDERCDSGPNSLDRTRAGVDLLDVDAGGEIVGHRASLENDGSVQVRRPASPKPGPAGRPGGYARVPERARGIARERGVTPGATPPRPPPAGRRGSSEAPPPRRRATRSHLSVRPKPESTRSDRRPPLPRPRTHRRGR